MREKETIEKSMDHAGTAGGTEPQDETTQHRTGRSKKARQIRESGGVNKDTWGWTTRLNETCPGLDAILGKLSFVECGRGRGRRRIQLRKETRQRHQRHQRHHSQRQTDLDVTGSREPQPSWEPRRRIVNGQWAVVNSVSRWSTVAFPPFCAVACKLSGVSAWLCFTLPPA